MKWHIETILHKMNFSIFIIVSISLFQTITDIKEIFQDSVLNGKIISKKIKPKEAKVELIIMQII